MRILHVLDHSVPLHSGYAFRTIAILKEQRRLGWSTVHVTSSKHYGSSQSEETVDGFKFYRTVESRNVISRTPVLNQLGVILDLKKRLESVLAVEHVDLIHAHSPCLNGIAALRVGRKAGIPVVYEMRASWEDAAVNHGTDREGSLRYRVSRALETHVLRRADAITTICDGLRRDILTRGIDAGKITVIPNAVDAEKFEAAQEPDSTLKAHLGLDGRKVCGFIGSFYGYEGLQVLLNALPIIRESIPGMAVLLVGGGPQEENLKAQARALRIQDDVIFVGRVPHEEVSRYYDLVDFLVYPRESIRLTEMVTPLKPLEAMAQSRLLVASDVGGHRELIQDGQTGSLFEAGNARALAESVVNLHDTPEIWPERLAAAREFVTRERTWSSSVGRYQRVYEHLLEGRK